MKRVLNCLLAAILVCSTSVFTSCKSNDDDNQADLNLSKKIIGKWIVTELDGQACPTNLKTVVTIASPTKAYGSLSDIYSNSWNVRAEADVKITGNKIYMTTKDDDNVSHVLETTVSSITDTYMLLKSDWTAYLDDKLLLHEAYAQERWERVTVDYQNDIIGMWEGKVSSAEDANSDSELHRWEYKADGTYAYYSEGGGTWIRSDDVLSEYFVDGTLLCTRWKNSADSKEIREWWEIESIQNGVMKWKALRMRDNGTTYTTTFEMKKVQ